MYVADFETCDAWESKEGEIPDQRVWFAGMKNLETMESKYFTNLDGFMAEVLGRGDNLNREYAFHNLKFDGSFIVPWLLRNGWEVVHNRPKSGQFSVLIDDRNNWYSITIQSTTKRKVTMWDSAKLFPIQLEYMHSIYGTPTQKIHEDEDFYNLIRLEDHVPTVEEVKYMENDLAVLAETLNEHIKYNGLRFKKTQASQSFFNFENHFKGWKLRFPALETGVDSEIRPAYWGGISHVNPIHAEKDIYDIVVYDINSSYPYQLAYKKLPYGRPYPRKEDNLHPDMSKFWVAEVLLKFELKEGKIPCIPSKAIEEGRPINAPHWMFESGGLVRMKFCCIDYLSMLESYDIEIVRWVWSIHFAWKVQPEIQKFVLQNNHDKEHYRKLAKKTKNNDLVAEYNARSQRAKIDNNSFYGKFGEDIIKYGKTPYYDKLNDDVYYSVDREDILSEYKRKYLPIAMATTAWGRRQLVKFANELGDDFVYCDTDSIHMLKSGLKKVDKLVKGGEIVMDPLRLGAWDKEGYFDRGRYLRSKCYYEERYGEIPEVTLAGLPADKHSGPRSKKRSIITWDNFHIGLKIPSEKSNKLGTRRTPTGNKLIPVPFEITEKVSYFF